MQDSVLDRESGIPIYRQLADSIREQISEGTYLPGDILPSEADYIRDFGLSRTTVRLAFGLLVNAGLVRREQGRGTIVVPQMRTQLPFLFSFTEESNRHGRVPGVILLKQHREQVSVDAAKALSLPGDAHILRVERLRLMDGEPIGLMISSMNTAKFPVLANLDYGALSVYSLFENETGLSLSSARENIRADLATAGEAQQLNIQAGAPVLRLLRTTYVQGAQDEAVPIEYARVVFNGSIYSLDVELIRRGDTGVSFTR